MDNTHTTKSSEPRAQSSKRRVLRALWNFTRDVVTFPLKQSGRAARYLYNHFVPEKFRKHKAVMNTGRVLVLSGRTVRGIYRLTSTEVAADKRHHFSARRLLISVASSAVAYTGAMVGYTYGLTNDYNNVVVSARDADKNGDFYIAGRIFTKDKDGVTDNKRQFQVKYSLLRPTLWHPDQVAKDIPSDARCDFKTYGAYWYSLLTQGVVSRPVIYQADCHPLTQVEKIEVQAAQTEAKGQENRHIRLDNDYFKRDYGFFKPATPQP